MTTLHAGLGNEETAPVPVNLAKGPPVRLFCPPTWPVFQRFAPKTRWRIYRNLPKPMRGVGPLVVDREGAVESLAIVAGVLEELNVRYFLSDGTLLGLVRENDFIAHDSDIDVGVLAEDFDHEQLLACVLRLSASGFTLISAYGEWGDCFELTWSRRWDRRRNVKIDIFFYWRRADKRIFHVFVDGKTPGHAVPQWYPAEMIEEREAVDFLGRTFMVPKDRVGYLRHKYGDWETPRRQWDWAYGPLNVLQR